jgi:hypothetical protein
MAPDQIFKKMMRSVIKYKNINSFSWIDSHENDSYLAEGK